MVVRPSSVSELAGALAEASKSRTRVTQVDLAQLNGILEYAPEDMTVTCEAGATLQSLQLRLAASRQWLPIDPPSPDTTSIGQLLAENLSGPRRYGCGTIRDYVIGLKVALADGRIIKSGGKVVKNVAGYDLLKLFIGGHGTIGVIVEVTFKVLPMPEAEQFVEARLSSLDEARVLVDSVLDAELNPVVLDLHNQSGAFVVVAGFAGATEDVSFQLATARQLGLSAASDLGHDSAFWNGQPAPKHMAVLPSELCNALGRLGAVSFVARAGNGVIYFRGDAEVPAPALPSKLLKRVKDTFDPLHVFPEAPWTT